MNTIGNIDVGELHFFGVRLPKKILIKLDYACKLQGRKKQACVEEALDMYADLMINECIERKRKRRGYIEITENV